MSLKLTLSEVRRQYSLGARLFVLCGCWESGISFGSWYPLFQSAPECRMVSSSWRIISLSSFFISLLLLLRSFEKTIKAAEVLSPTDTLMFKQLAPAAPLLESPQSFISTATSKTVGAGPDLIQLWIAVVTSNVVHVLWEPATSLPTSSWAEDVKLFVSTS